MGGFRVLTVCQKPVEVPTKKFNTALRANIMFLHGSMLASFFNF